MQYIINGVINGAAYGVCGLSFGLVLSVTGRFHFAWALGYSIVGFAAAYLSEQKGVPVAFAALLGLAAGVLVMVLVEAFIYRPVARRASGDSALALFVASVGLATGGAALIRFLDTGASGLGSYNFTWVSAETHKVGSATYTTLDLVSVLVLVVTAVIVWVTLRFTPLGRQIHAVKDNPLMASAVGIRSNRTYLYVFAIATSAAGVAALLQAMRFSATPDMGMSTVFYAFVVAFLAGIGRSPLVTLATGIGLGLLESISLNWVSTAWQTTVVFGVLLVFLAGKALAASGLLRRVTVRPRLAGISA